MKLRREIVTGFPPVFCSRRIYAGTLTLSTIAGVKANAFRSNDPA
jgi:hypothetical protein